MSDRRCIFLIHTTRKNKNGQSIYIHFACGYETLEELVSAFDSYGTDIGDQLWTQWGTDQDGRYLEITSRTGVAVRASSIEGIEVPRMRYIENSSGEER